MVMFDDGASTFDEDGDNRMWNYLNTLDTRAVTNFMNESAESLLLQSPEIESSPDMDLLPAPRHGGGLGLGGRGDGAGGPEPETELSRPEIV